MDTSPEYTTIRVWKRTLKALRMIHALTGESMVQVLERLITTELRRLQERDEK